MTLAGGFRCLELCLYDIRKLATVISETQTTSRPFFPEGVVEGETVGVPVAVSVANL